MAKSSISDNPDLWLGQRSTLVPVPDCSGTAASVANPIIFEKLFTLNTVDDVTGAQLLNDGIYLRIRATSEAERSRDSSDKWVAQILKAIHEIDDQPINDPRLSQHFSTYMFMPQRFKDMLRASQIVGKGQLIEYMLESVASDTNHTFSFYLANLFKRWESEVQSESRLIISLSNLFSVALSVFLSSSVYDLTEKRIYEYMFSMSGFIPIQEYVDIFNCVTLETIRRNRITMFDNESVHPIPFVSSDEFSFKVVPRNERPHSVLTCPGKYGARYVTFSSNTNHENIRVKEGGMFMYHADGHHYPKAKHHQTLSTDFIYEINLDGLHMSLSHSDVWRIPISVKYGVRAEELKCWKTEFVHWDRLTDSVWIRVKREHADTGNPISSLFRARGFPLPYKDHVIRAPVLTFRSDVPKPRYDWRVMSSDYLNDFAVRVLQLIRFYSNAMFQSRMVINKGCLMGKPVTVKTGDPVLSLAFPAYGPIKTFEGLTKKGAVGRGIQDNDFRFWKDVLTFYLAILYYRSLPGPLAVTLCEWRTASYACGQYQNSNNDQILWSHLVRYLQDQSSSGSNDFRKLWPPFRRRIESKKGKYLLSSKRYDFELEYDDGTSITFREHLSSVSVRDGSSYLDEVVEFGIVNGIQL